MGGADVCARRHDCHVSGKGEDEALGKIADFNQRWPEFAIDAKHLKTYLKRRVADEGKTEPEKMSGKKYESLLPASR